MASAIANILLLIAIVGLVFIVISQPRWQSRRFILRLIYRNVDESLGARRFLNDLRATRRHKLYRRLRFGTLGIMKKTTALDFAEFFYPHTQLGGIMALPSLRTRKKFIFVAFRAKSWPRPYTRKDVTLVRTTWTSEAKVFRFRRPSFVTELEWGLCRALDLVWHEKLFYVTDHRTAQIVGEKRNYDIEPMTDKEQDSEDEEEKPTPRQIQGPGQFSFEFARERRIYVPGDLRGEAELAMNHIGGNTEELDA